MPREMRALRHVTDPGVRAVEVEAGIAAAWEKLGDLHEQDLVTVEQLEYVATQEPPEDVHLYLRTIWLARLHQWIAQPEAIGANPDALDPLVCASCHGTGWTEDERGAKPCGECNPDQYALWRDHWRHPGHICPECAPKLERTKRSGRRRDADRDDGPAAADVEDRAVQEELI